MIDKWEKFGPFKRGWTMIKVAKTHKDTRRTSKKLNIESSQSNRDSNPRLTTDTLCCFHLDQFPSKTSTCLSDCSSLHCVNTTDFIDPLLMVSTFTFSHFTVRGFFNRRLSRYLSAFAYCSSSKLPKYKVLILN